VHGSVVLRTVGASAMKYWSEINREGDLIGEHRADRAPALLLVPPPCSEIVLSNMDNSA
jgi:hypothetical protein